MSHRTRLVKSETLVNRVRRWRAEGRTVGLALDYDGTLTPIVAKPGAARLLPHIRGRLRRLGRRPGVVLAIVSGRRLTDVAERVGVPGLTYVGLHGLERRWRKGRTERLWRTVDSTRIQRLARAVVDASSFQEGWRVDHKGPAVGFHHRGLTRTAAARLRRAVTRACGRLRGPWRLIENRRTLEVTAVAVHKGDALRWIKGKLGPRSRMMYWGDDRTDEDAFGALSPQDIGAVVSRGARPTRARYRVASVVEVHRFLDTLLKEG